MCNSARHGSLLRLLLDCDFGGAKELLSSGVDVNASLNDQGWTALHMMVENYAVEAVAFLLENCADPNRADAAGMTPLHLSVDIESDAASQAPPKDARMPISPRLEITRLLLSHGASPDIQNRNGETAFDWAKRARHEAAVNLFKSKA